MAQRRDGHDAGAVGGRRDGVARAVAGRCHDQRADGADLGRGVAIRRVAAAFAAEAQVDDAGRIRVVGNAVHVQPGSPADARDDVGIEAAAFAQHAHRQHAHRAADAGHADRVVGDGADEAGDLRAVPRAVARARVAVLERPAGLRQFGSGHGIARVGRIGVAAVAVVRRRHVAHHVVARQQIAAGADAQQIVVIEAHARIEHRDDDAWAALGDAPRGRCIDGGRNGRVRRLQVPLAGRRAGRRHRRGQVQRVVRNHAGRAAPLVDHGIFDIALLTQPGRQRLRTHTVREHHLAALGDRRACAQHNAGTQAELLGAADLARADRQRAQSQETRIGAVFDDHAGTWRGRGAHGLRARRAIEAGPKRAQQDQRGQLDFSHAPV